MATTYVVLSWPLIQVAEGGLPVFGMSVTGVRGFILIAAAGLTPVQILAWAFGPTPESLKRDRQVDQGSAASVKTTRRLAAVKFEVILPE